MDQVISVVLSKLATVLKGFDQVVSKLGYLVQEALVI